jgi:hypothetical protein
MEAEIVYKKDEIWYQADMYVWDNINKVGLSNEKRVYTTFDVHDVDNYIHVSKHPMKNRLKDDLRKINIDCDFAYIKYMKPENEKKISDRPCKTCIKTCKSDFVLDCNCYDDGKSEGEDAWKI